MFNYLRFRWRRALRRWRRDSRTLRKWFVHYVDRHIWGKWHQVQVVRRFLAIWWLIAAIALIGLWQQIGGLQRMASVTVAEPGGTYTEAAVGTVQALNPVLPESTTASDINRLIFSGLTRYNSHRKLVADLATSWDVSADGKVYTFHLRQGVKWHDNVPFTSADVAFTFTAIQNPDSRSPLASSWQGVTVSAKDDYTVAFTLPQPLNSFLDSTTIGIVPRHSLENVDPGQLREAGFNQHPIGTGPFKIKTFAPSAREIELTANPDYYLGRPQLADFNFKFYDTPEDTLRAYAQRQVTSPGRLRPGMANPAGSLSDLTEHTFTLPEEQTLFFNTADPVLSDKGLRQILSRSLNRQAVMEAAEHGQGVVVTQPLLPGQTGYTNKYALGMVGGEEAREALANAGWVQASGQPVRTKAGARLQLKLVTLAGGELERAAREIKRQWAPLGIGVEVKAVESEQLQQSYMRPRNFQMLLYGVNIGADPDVYSFWHSSQVKDPGLNLSGYSSTEADKALETARIKSDQLIRIGKYDAFLKAWNADTPAAVLYQTGYAYGTRENVDGLVAQRLVVPADRFYGVERWTIRTRYVPAR